MLPKPNPRRWTREESLIVFNLYCRIPFNASNKFHPDVRYIAQLVDRTPDAVNMKIGNFGSLDPELQKRGIRGLRNASRLDQAVWDEFHQNWEAMIDESLRLIAERERAVDITPRDVEDIREYEDNTPREGRERLSTVTVRENQRFFRRTILVVRNLCNDG